jgi:hypothetical protein
MTRPIVEPGTHDEGEAFGRLALVAVAIYMAILLYLMIAAGLWPTLDLVVVGIAVRPCSSGEDGSSCATGFPSC